MKQGKTLSQLAAEIERQKDAARDMLADTRVMTFDNGTLDVGGQPNTYGPDVGPHATYLRQHHFVAGTVTQGLVALRNGRPDPKKWRELSRYVETFR